MATFHTYEKIKSTLIQKKQIKPNLPKQLTVGSLTLVLHNEATLNPVNLYYCKKQNSAIMQI